MKLNRVSFTAVAMAGAMLALPLTQAMAQDKSPIKASVDISTTEGPVLDPNIQGQFIEVLGHGIEGGIWVGEDSPIPNTRGFRNDLITAFKALKVPVVRWPGGCYADYYHWQDGIGPRTERPVTLNTSWGGVEESNAVGTKEMFDFAEMVGAKFYLNINVGTGTPREMMDWIEYITSDKKGQWAEARRKDGREQPWKLDYIGVGNETWGCGGLMSPEYYNDIYRQYAEFIRVPGDNRPVKVASGANASDYNWTEVMMSKSARHMGALTLHYYTLPTGKWSRKGAGVGFTEQEWADTFVQTNRMEEILTGHIAVMDKHDPQKRVKLYVDEWGTWYDPEPGSNPSFLMQPNSLRDGLITAVNFNIFHRHADRVTMTNIAQGVNVLQAMARTEGEKMYLTPTYHVFRMYVPFQGAKYLKETVTTPDYVIGGATLKAVDATAARGTDGKIYLSIVNLDPNRPAEITATFGGKPVTVISGEVLTADRMDEVNSFDQPNRLTPKPVKQTGKVSTIKVPSKSVTVLVVEPAR